MTSLAKERSGRSSSFHVMTMTLGNLIGPMSTLACAPLLAHHLGVEGRGELAASTMPLVLLAAALTLGLPEAITHRLGQRPNEGRQALVVSTFVLLAAGLVAVGVLVLAAPSLAAESGSVADLIRWSALAAVPTIVLWALRGTAQGLQQWSTLNAEKAVTGLVRLSAIGGLALTQRLDLTSAFIVLIVSPICGYLAYLNMLRRLPTSHQKPEGLRLSRDLTTFGSKVWLGSIAGILLTRLDQVLILPLSDAEQLGLYAAAVNVGDIPFFMTAAFGSLMLAKESADSSNERVAFASRALFFIVLCLTLVVATTVHLWFGALFGASFSDGADTAVILLLAALVSAPGTIAGTALTGRGHAHDRSLAIVAGLIVNVLVIILLVPSLGSIGAGIATLGGTVVVTSIVIIQVWIRFGIRPDQMLLIRLEDFRKVSKQFLGRTRSGSKNQNRSN
ncbi:oligosaccharide flippase family protein [Pseudarthrobacter oxydans]|uniref:oligosaccharide flippase family protein n=1 Tax=Pseudarthrobacter oxydans TaxID=1671 RepID=UPI0035E4BD0D